MSGRQMKFPVFITTISDFYFLMFIILLIQIFFFPILTAISEEKNSEKSEEGPTYQQSEVFLAIDTSGSMAGKLKDAKRVIKDCVRYTNGKISKIHGFFAVGKSGTAGDFQWIPFNSIDEVVMPNELDLSDTQSPLDKGLDKGLDEIQKYHQTVSAMLWYVTDEILDPLGTINHPTTSVVEGQREKFRGILKGNEGFPWALHFNFVSSSGQLYKLYLLIHYDRKAISPIEHDEAVNNFLKFIDVLSQKLNQKAFLLKYDYPGKDVQFNVIVNSQRKTFRSGEHLSPFFDYILTYMPKSYNLVEGDLTPAGKEEKQFLSVKGFSSTSSISPDEYEFNIPGSVNNTVQLKNLTEGGNVPIGLDLITNKVLKPGWKDLFSLRNSGEVIGTNIFKLSEAQFIPIPQKCANIDLSRLDMKSNPKRVITQQFTLKVSYLPWFIFLRWLIFCIIVGIIIYTLILYKRRSEPFPIEARVMGVSEHLKFQLVPDGREDIVIYHEDNPIKIGTIKRNGGIRKFQYIPSPLINQVNNGPPPEKVDIKQDEPIKLTLKEDDISGNTGGYTTIIFQRQNVEEIVKTEAAESTSRLYTPEP